MANDVQPGEASAAGARARESAEQLKERAVGQVEVMKERAVSNKEKLSERVRRVGSAIHSAGDEIRGDEERWAGYVDQVSQRFERAADYLRNTEPREALRDAESFARREPALFFGGAFVLGLAVGRLLRASTHHEERAYDETDDAYVEGDPTRREMARPGDTWTGSLEGDME